eukprot:349671_1
MSLQFNQDRELLNRLNAFYFHETELDVSLNSMYSDDFDSKLNDEKDNILSIEQLESMNDRLLVYTASFSASIAASLPILMNKDSIVWTNDDIVKFFECQLTINSQLINGNERNIILKLLKGSNISGNDLFKKVINSNQLEKILLIAENEFEWLGGSQLRQELILMELLKVIQMQQMVDQVNNLLVKVEIIKKIQNVRKNYHHLGDLSSNLINQQKQFVEHPVNDAKFSMDY